MVQNKEQKKMKPVKIDKRKNDRHQVKQELRNLYARFSHY